MTAEDIEDSITDIVPSDDKKAISERLLDPLLAGKSVILAIRDFRMPKKQRIKTPVLILVPGVLLGRDRGHMLAAIPGYGAALLNLSKPLKGLEFYRMGLNLKLSNVLARSLNDVLKLGE